MIALFSERLPQLLSAGSLTLILLLQGLLGVGMALSLPAWQQHEADFYNVMRFIRDERRLPTLADYPSGDAAIRQATQPVLYFLLMTPLVALLDDGAPVPPGVNPPLICPGGAGAAAAPLTTPDYDFPPRGSALAMYALRIVGVAMGAAAAACAFAAARRFFPAHPAAAWTAAALLAFEPNLLRQSAMIGNDTLLLLLASANLWALARLLDGRPRPAAVLPVLAFGTLAVLTRLPGWAVLALDGAVLFALVVRAQTRRRGGARYAALGLTLLIGAAAAVAVFNLALYGSLLGRYETLDRVVVETLRTFELPWAALVGIFDQTRLDYLSPLDVWQPRLIIARLYTLIPLVGLALGIAALLWALWQRQRERVGLAVAVLALALGVGLVVMRNLTYATAANTTLYDTSAIFAPLRYYMPGLPALALLIGAGAALTAGALPLVRRFAALLPLIALPWLAVAVLNAAAALAQTPSAVRVDELPADVQRLNAAPNETPRLLAYELRYAADRLDLTLYLTADAALTTNWMGRVTVGDAPCEFIPGDGTYPTTRWTPGEIVRVALSVPYCPIYGAALEAGAPVALAWLPVDARGVISGDAAPADSLGVTDAPLSRAESCPPTLGVVGESYQIVKFNSPEVVRAGDTYIPSLNWQVYEPNPAAVARMFVFRHDETGIEYPCNQTSLYVSAWQRGVRVFFDGCAMRFPPDAPRGRYTTLVGIQDRAFAYLPALDADANAAFVVPVGSIVVE